MDDYMMNDYTQGFNDAIRKAIDVCQIAFDAFDNGAGSANSLEVRGAAKSQAEWCRENIRILTK